MMLRIEYFLFQREVYQDLLIVCVSKKQFHEDAQTLTMVINSPDMRLILSLDLQTLNIMQALMCICVSQILQGNLEIL